jgi:hypothetical protein
MKQIRTYARLMLLGVALSLVAGCATQSNGIPRSAAPPPPLPEKQFAAGAAPASWTGAAAIVPPPDSPITDAQVRAYVLSHRVPLTVNATNVAVVSTSFVSSRKVSDLLQTPRMGVPDEEPMCLVVMSGKFVFGGPPGANPTYPVGVEVFDARTGNVLQVGGMLSPPPATGS